MVYRMGFAASRKAARQLIRHRHVEVNGQPVDIPRYLVQPGEEGRGVARPAEPMEHACARHRLASQRSCATPRRSRSPHGIVGGSPDKARRPDCTELPDRAMAIPTQRAQEQLVVELYSEVTED